MYIAACCSMMDLDRRQHEQWSLLSFHQKNPLVHQQSNKSRDVDQKHEEREAVHDAVVLLTVCAQFKFSMEVRGLEQWWLIDGVRFTV